MRLEQRQEQVSRANWIAEGRPFHFPPLPAIIDRGLKERLESNSKTSTTEPLETMNNSRGIRRQPVAKRSERVRPIHMTASDPQSDLETAGLVNGGQLQEIPIAGTLSTEQTAQVSLETGTTYLWPTASIISCATSMYSLGHHK